jgi:hypothetical protein
VGSKILRRALGLDVTSVRPFPSLRRDQDLNNPLISSLNSAKPPIGPPAFVFAARGFAPTARVAHKVSDRRIRDFGGEFGPTELRDRSRRS